MPHIHDKIDFTVEVFIVHDDKVLLRKHDKYGLWLSVGGHVELDEDPNEAAVREVKEEVGLEVELYNGAGYTYEEDGYTELIPPQYMNRHDIGDDHEHVTLVYFATTDDPTIEATEGREQSEDLCWLTEAELAEIDLRDSIEHYAKDALETLS